VTVAVAGKIVVDSSVLVKWVKARDEDLVLQARRLLRQVEARGLEIHVPALLLYEVGNVLLTRTSLDHSGLADALAHLESLPLIVAPPASPLLTRAGWLGRDLGLTFYDASFVALAVELDCPFVTADRRLWERARGLPRVRHLSRVGALR